MDVHIRHGVPLGTQYFSIHIPSQKSVPSYLEVELRTEFPRRQYRFTPRVTLRSLRVIHVELHTEFPRSIPQRTPQKTDNILQIQERRFGCPSHFEKRQFLPHRCPTVKLSVK